EPELLVIIGANPLGGVDSALLQRRVNVASSDLLRYAAKLLDRQAGKSADAEFEALEVGDFLDLLAEPSAHLAARIGRRQRVDVELLAELVEQPNAVAVIKPGILLPRIEPERDRAEQREGRVLAKIIVCARMARLDGTVAHRIQGLQAGNDFAG